MRTVFRLAMVFWGVSVAMAAPVQAADTVFVEVRPLRVLYDEGRRAGYLSTVLRFADAAKARRACARMPALAAALVKDLFDTPLALKEGTSVDVSAMAGRFTKVAGAVLGAEDGAGKVYVVDGMLPTRGFEKMGYAFPRPVRCGDLLDGAGGRRQ